MGLLDGFEDIYSPAQQVRNDGMCLKIHKRNFTFSLAACRALECDRIKIRFHMQKHIIAIVPCYNPREGVRINQRCATIASSKNLGAVVDSYFTSKNMLGGMHDTYKIHGDFKKVTENGKIISAVFFDLDKAKVE